jgi:GNAT superfamily N-acetyltransferase
MATAADSPDRLPADVTIRNDLEPGDIGCVTYLHAVLYAEDRGWDASFEAYVAGPLAEFAKSQTDRERIWIVEQDEKVAGSIAIVEASQEEAQLRWLLLHPHIRGLGLGRLLVEEAVDFCRECGYASIFLWTVAGLEAAMHLYESLGFELTEEETHPIWGAVVTEQRYDLKLR